MVLDVNDRNGTYGKDKFKAARTAHLVNRLDSLGIATKSSIASALGVSDATLMRYLNGLTEAHIQRILAVLQTIGINNCCICLVESGCIYSDDLDADLDRIDYALHTSDERSVLRGFGEVIFKHREP